MEYTREEMFQIKQSMKSFETF